eukprot:4285228-Amphidinium_carterae.1
MVGYMVFLIHSRARFSDGLHVRREPSLARLETEFKSHCQVVESRFESMEKRLKQLEDARAQPSAATPQNVQENVDDLVAIL